jgi:hypothetical protein
MDALDPESAAKLPNLLRLRDALYSDEFRGFVSDITGGGARLPLPAPPLHTYAAKRGKPARPACQRPSTAQRRPRRPRPPLPALSARHGRSMVAAPA